MSASDFTVAIFMECISFSFTTNVIQEFSRND